jgi:hypothetical protein
VKALCHSVISVLRFITQQQPLIKKFSITHEQMNMFGEILQQFADKIPVTVMVQCLLEGLLNPQKIDECLESVRGEQYTRKIFSSGPLIPKT